jgi:hypothetical protein
VRPALYPHSANGHELNRTQNRAERRKKRVRQKFFATPSKKFGSHGTPLQSNPDFIVAGSLLNCSASSRKTKVFEAFVQLALLA